MAIKDQSQRLQALDPASSYIVQAPAGSGKTELLTQRFLVLLARVKAPEEVVAITFTRKAAAEMRARIIDALDSAANGQVPEKPHSLQTWHLAKQVLIKDHKANWHLKQNPNRLRVLTIDSLCAKIAKSAPLLANLGAMPNLVEDAKPFYLEAAHRLLADFEDSPWLQALQVILLHLDNNMTLMEKLVIDMLSRRDQWLPHIFSFRHNQQKARKLLEQGLNNLITDTLFKANSLLGPFKEELLQLAYFASQQLKLADIDSPIRLFYDLDKFPAPSADNLCYWVALSELLLTKSNEWRRSINKTLGFPPDNQAANQIEKVIFKTNKQKMLNLLSRLQENEPLHVILKEIRLLPSAEYADKQWQVVNALLDLLPILVAYLTIVFQENHVTDFIAITQGAIQALGDIDSPSDVALNLDYRIQHLLVDEFQDTSITQYRLLELLTAGWQPHDGRTLFLVGDPMQSIYRFREAEVGLFLKVKHQGLGQIQLVPLTLEVNFRSTPQLVIWLNDLFKHVFPQQENEQLGAIPFSPSTAALAHTNVEPCVHIHAFNDEANQTQACKLIEIVKQELTHCDNKSIAILVRSRNHLQPLIPQLKQAMIPFQAVNIEKLIDCRSIKDLLALTKAIAHTGDRIAWLTLLRAPWAGLSLIDLHALVHYEPTATIWKNLTQVDKINGLSEFAQRRLNSLIPIFENAISERSRLNVRQLVSYTWYALGGPACLEEAYEMDSANAFFDLLEQFHDITAVDFSLLTHHLNHEFSSHTNKNARVQLMTIHKAKGLEFDVVIIPCLEKKSAIDDSKLLLWLERQTRANKIDLILAPIRSREEECDPIYRYVKRQQALKAELEVTRLLYVATSRAKNTLHLLASEIDDNNQQMKPQTGSFLQLLWQKLQPFFQSPLNYQINEKKDTQQIAIQQPLHRLTEEWHLPPHLLAIAKSDYTLSEMQFNWSLCVQNHIGVIIHKTLQLLSESSLPLSVDSFFSQNEKIWQKQLIQQGVPLRLLPGCLDSIKKAISLTLSDERGRWVLDCNHFEAKSEYPLSLNSGTVVTQYIIDRTFIDEKGIRWVIDYKNTEFDTSKSKTLLAFAQKNYAEQLNNYARALWLLDKKPTKLAVYFPLFAGWCKWDFNNEDIAHAN